MPPYRGYRNRNAKNENKRGSERYVQNEGKVSVASVATDRHVMVRSLMKKKFEEKGVVHNFDVYHMANTARKDVMARSKTKERNGLEESWLRSIVNQLWWSSRTSGGDHDLHKIFFSYNVRVRIKVVMMMIKYFSRLTMVHFKALFMFLVDAVNNLIYWNNGSSTTTATSTKKGPARQTEPLEELFLTLVRLRQEHDLNNLNLIVQGMLLIS